MTTLAERFWAKVDRRGEDDCWLWIAHTDRYGYGKFYAAPNHRSEPAHRVAHELLVGPIPDGLTIDHLCRNRACVNPVHLEAVTMAENVARGISRPALNARKTECDNGHPFDEANTHVSPKGARICRACDRERHSRWWRRHHAQEMAS